MSARGRVSVGCVFRRETQTVTLVCVCVHDDTCFLMINDCMFVRWWITSCMYFSSEHMKRQQVEGEMTVAGTCEPLTLAVKYTYFFKSCAEKSQ